MAEKDERYDKAISKKHDAVFCLGISSVVTLFAGLILFFGGGDLIAIIFLAFFGLSVFFSHQKSKADEILKEYSDAEKAQVQFQEDAVFKKYEEICRSCGCPDKPIISDGKRIWIAYNHLYEIEPFWEYRKRYPKEIVDFAKLAEQGIDYKMIPVNNIQYFSKEGDVQYTSRISGGGGGGSSIAGALVGGAIAGNTGAIIGSRKKVNDIKTTTERHDSRRTIVRYFENQSIKTLNYSGFGVYDYLLTQIPNKDLLTMQLNHSSGVVAPRVEESQDVKDKLKKLQDLYNSGLITDVEYANKRQNLLNDL